MKIMKEVKKTLKVKKNSKNNTYKLNNFSLATSNKKM